MKLPLRYYGDPVLRTKAEPVQEITPEIRKLAEDLIETMIEQNGVGLAAPQVGVLLRIFVRRDEVSLADGRYTLGPPEVLINPEITRLSEEEVGMVEGCLSIPGVRGMVMRPKKIRIRYQTLEGAWKEEERDDFLARVTMHENDHLNGVLYVDRLSLEERKRIEPRLRQIKKQSAAAIR